MVERCGLNGGRRSWEVHVKSINSIISVLVLKELGENCGGNCYWHGFWVGL